MAKQMKPKSKYWRRMANKLTIVDSRIEKNEVGEDIEVKFDRTLSGREIKRLSAFTEGSGYSSNLLQSLFKKAGLDNNG